MIKKKVLDLIEKKLSNQKTLLNYLQKHYRKRDKLTKSAYLALKKEARAIDTLMRDAVQSGDVEFQSDNKNR